MAYTTIAASQTDADSPIDQVLMDAIRTDLDDLNSRLQIIEAKSDSAIYDDFTETTILGTVASAAGTDAQPYTWDVFASGAGTSPAISANPDHWLRLQVNGGSSILTASAFRMRFDLDRDHTIVMETRLKCTSGTDADMFFGFQDDALPASLANNTDLSDAIAFVRGTNSNTLKFFTARASSTDSSDNLGDTSAWITLKIAVTYAGSTKEVRAYTGTTQANYVEVAGSPFTTTTKHPNVRLKPWFGISGGGGSRTADLDYILAYWNARPLST